MNLLPADAGRPERVSVVHALTQAAFAPHARLERPSGALRESEADVAADLAAGGGLIAYDDSWRTPLGALRWRPADGHLWVKRVAVVPAAQGRGVGALLMDASRGVAVGLGLDEIRLGVRDDLPGNLDWYRRRHFEVATEHDDWKELRLRVRPFPYRRPVRLVKYEWPDEVQVEFTVDLLEEVEAGLWVGIPAFAPSLRDGKVVWIPSRAVVAFLPWGQWWVSSWSAAHLRVKVDICTPVERPSPETIAFRDLCLDVVVEGDAPAVVVDEDEFAEHLPGGSQAPYPAEVAEAAQRTAGEILGRIHAGEHLFHHEGPARLARYSAAQALGDELEA